MRSCTRCRQNGTGSRRGKMRLYRWSSRERSGASGAPGDSLRQRWRYFPRLVRLLWELGPRHLVLLAIFSLAGGLLPVLSLVLLQRLVDSALGVITGAVPLGVAVLWLITLLVAHFLHAVTDFWENGWAGLLENTQERMKARA